MSHQNYGQQQNYCLQYQQQQHRPTNQHLYYNNNNNSKLGPNYGSYNSNHHMSSTGTGKAAGTNRNNNNDSLSQSTESQNNRTTDSQTMMHILKANIGTGVLAMPSAFRNVGLWPSFVLVPLIGAICIHCMNILIQSQNKLCDRFNYESLDYDQVAALSMACGPKFARRLAKYASAIVTVFLMFTQFGFCCVYILFVVNNIQLAAFNLLTLNYTTTTYLLIVFPLIAITSCTSNLKHLARISTIANILQLAGLALIFFDLLQFHTFEQQQPVDYATNETTSSVSSIISKNNVVVEQGFNSALVSGLPLFFATAVYAFEGIGVVLPLIKEMQTPDHIGGLNGVLNTSMSLVAILYMGVGFFGYSKYGQFVEGSITLNLPETTLNEFVRLIFAIAIGLSYALQFYVPWAIVWPIIDESLFYSYRPRVARDKLDILNKLSADNEWLINSSTGSTKADDDDNDEGKQEEDGDAGKEGDATKNNDASDLYSNASTLATSYSMSVCAPLTGSRSLQNSLQVSGTQTGVLPAAPRLAPLVEKAPLDLGPPPPPPPMQPSSQQVYFGGTKATRRKHRNRMDDVMKRSGSPQSDEPAIPEVQWRPPPRSMRGKRKVVRYTVIMVAVALTFVAAALIPRLDLFISLIGALASSCLAIIFPALIQLCTFWDNTRWDANDDDHDDDDHEDADSSGESSGEFYARDRNKRERAARKLRRRAILWRLFVFKNIFLVFFGILGLITGSWVTLIELGTIYK